MIFLKGLGSLLSRTGLQGDVYVNECEGNDFTAGQDRVRVEGLAAFLVVIFITFCL